MRSFHSVMARSAREICDAQRVRHQVYVEEEEMLPTVVGARGRDIDDRDDRDTALHFLIYAEDEPVGTVRLLLPEGRCAGHLGLPLEAKLDLSQLAGVQSAEVTRFCVLRRYRSTGVTAALFAGLYLESARRGITHWVAGANMGTDFPEDALVAYQLACAQGLSSTRFHAEPRAFAAPCPPRRRPLYTADQRRRAAHGDLRGLDLPRTLALFAHRMGARFIGPPVYDDRFRIFALPLCTALADLAAERERPRGRFP